MVDQRLDLGERRALGPVVDCLRIRPSGLVDAAVEVLEIRLRDGEGEGSNGVAHPAYPLFRLGKSGERHGITSFVVGDANLLIRPSGH
jgi:hypothetical protein